MKKFSKTLTLNKIHIINNIIDQSTSGSPSSDYFNIGAPIGNPPRLRGSIVIEMNSLFLTDNCDFFKAGSPIDTGSIKFGFFKPKLDQNLFLEMVNCDYEKFYTLATDLYSLPWPAVEKINSHIACSSARPVLEKYFSAPVVDFMFQETDPHAWLFEFCLDAGYALKKNHINRIHIPNTYTFSPTIRKLCKDLNGKVATYNPKYGIEGRGI